MRHMIVFEPTEYGVAIQVPDLAIIAHGEDFAAAHRAAYAAIQANIAAYRGAGLPVPEKNPVEQHPENPEFSDLLFAYVAVTEPREKITA